MALRNARQVERNFRSHRSAREPPRSLAAAASACCLALLPLAAASPASAYGGTAVPDRPLRRLAGSEFSTVTPENVMKWEAVEPRQGEYDYAAADRLVDFARRHGQKVRGHVLVRHNQLPSWLTAGDFSADRLREILHRHITDTVRHFKSRVWQGDVVNEAFNVLADLREPGTGVDPPESRTGTPHAPSTAAGDTSQDQADRPPRRGSRTAGRRPGRRAERGRRAVPGRPWR
ncbi:endo-1,4-beta-xylanase [Streptomyces flaveolus]|uniref:endo-1,4-beta-xylanase n=1 Tax=Streptomyces flaveolus TaxID=67297 RepID=UPI0033AD2613